MFLPAPDPEDKIQVAKVIQTMLATRESVITMRTLKGEKGRLGFKMINIVAGPPGSGKTTYVLKNKHRGDAVIDLDFLFQAVTGLPMYDKPEALLGFVIELKRAAIEEALHFHAIHMISNVWIITAGAKVQDRHWVAGQSRADHVYILNPPVDECIRRISLDTRRNSRMWYWRKLVRQWNEEFEPHPGDEYLPTSVPQSEDNKREI